MLPGLIWSQAIDRLKWCHVSSTFKGHYIIKYLLIFCQILLHLWCMEFNILMRHLTFLFLFYSFSCLDFWKRLYLCAIALTFLLIGLGELSSEELSNDEVIYRIEDIQIKLIILCIIATIIHGLINYTPN